MSTLTQTAFSHPQMCDNRSVLLQRSDETAVESHALRRMLLLDDAVAELFVSHHTAITVAYTSCISARPSVRPVRRHHNPSGCARQPQHACTPAISASPVGEPVGDRTIPFVLQYHAASPSMSHCVASPRVCLIPQILFILASRSLIER